MIAWWRCDGNRFRSVWTNPLWFFTLRESEEFPLIFAGINIMNFGTRSENRPFVTLFEEDSVRGSEDYRGPDIALTTYWLRWYAAHSKATEIEVNDGYVLGISLLQQWGPELVRFRWVHEHQPVVIRREPVVNNNVRPLAILPKLQAKKHKTNST